MPADVAVIVPCFNHGAYLPEAVASVRAQTYRAAELVVVDDGSTDTRTRRVLERLRAEGVFVLAQSNQGLAAARNAGVRATTAPLFVPLDADDRLHPEFLARLVPVLRQDSRLGYVYCHARFFGARTSVWRCPPYDPRQLVLHNLSTAMAVVRRAAFEAVGGYRTDMTHGYEDWDLWLALGRAGYKGRCVPQPLCEYRQHGPGTSMLAQLAPHRDEMVRRMIARHRAWFCELLGLPLETDEETVFVERAAAIELDALVRSRLWRLLHFGRAAAAGAPGAQGDTPRARLAVARASRAFALIQALKRTRLYRGYARARYGS